MDANDPKMVKKNTELDHADRPRSLHRGGNLYALAPRAWALDDEAKAIIIGYVGRRNG